jgi:hypothetical protein
MRPSVWVCLLTFVILAVGIRVHSPSVRAAGKATKARAAAAANAAPSWVVEGFEAEGRWMKTQEEAIESALEKGQAELIARLQAREPRIAWVPPVDFIRDNLLEDLRPQATVEHPAAASILRPIHRSNHWMLEEERDFKEELGVMRRVRLKVAVGSDDFSKIRQHDGEYRKQQRQVVSQQRQLVLAKGLAAVVAVLAALAGYFRLEEATKGYYTNWLRMAALGLVAAVAAGLLVLG